MRVLMLDPGSRNFGYSVLEIDGKGFRYLEIGQIEKTIVNLTANPHVRKPKRRKKAGQAPQKIPKDGWPVDHPLHVMLPRYYKTMSRLIKDYGIDEVVMERFQSRGLKGSTIEAVSIMVGILLGMLHRMKIKSRLVTAGQWKNQINRHINLDNTYKITAKFGYTPHETDACFMGIYHYHSHYNGELEWATQVPEKMENYSNESG